MSTLITTGILLSLFLAAYYLLFQRSRCHHPLPPGPRGLPIVGYLPFLRRDLHRQFAELAKTHGPIMSVRLGSKTCVLISSPETACEIYRNQDLIFANRDPPASALGLFNGGQDMVWSPNGPFWRLLRKLTVREMMNHSKLDAFAPLRRLELSKMLQHVMECSGTPVDLVEEIFVALLNSVTAMLWGGTPEGEERRKVAIEFRQVIEEAMELIGAANISDFFPILACLDLQGIVRKSKEKHKWIDKIFSNLIEKRLKNMENSSSATQETDFLQVLLSLSMEDDNKELSISNIKALFIDLVMGGTDTISTTLCWAMAELLNDPESLKRAQEEINEVVGKDNLVEESHLPNLPYTKAIIKEALRLHPVVPLLTPRRPSETSIVAGYTVPHDTQILVNAWAIHRDPKYWDNPLQFKPERFLEENCNLQYSGGNDFRYIPFGGGRRKCVGILMADRMSVHILASLLHCFDWKLPEGVKLDLSDQFGIVLKKATPLLAVPIAKGYQ